MEPEDLFAGHPQAAGLFERVRAAVTGLGPCEVRTSRSQVAFRRARGFAYAWRPGQYLSHPGAELVLSIALGRHEPSPRFKEVAHPAPGQWMHHLELHGPDDVDDEVLGWLREAAERAT